MIYVQRSCPPLTPRILNYHSQGETKLLDLEKHSTVSLLLQQYLVESAQNMESALNTEMGTNPNHSYTECNIKVHF